MLGRLCVVEGGEGDGVEAAAGVLLPWWWGAGGPNPHQLPRVLAWEGGGQCHSTYCNSSVQLVK